MMRPNPRRAIIAMLFVVGLAWVAVAEWVGAGGDLGGDPRQILMDVLPWLLFQWVGLLVMSRARDPREGILLYLVGMVLPLQTLMMSTDPSLFWPSVLVVGAGFWGLSRVLLQHAVLAFPTGQLPGRSERLFLAISYLLLIVTQALVIATSDTDTYLQGFTRNPFLVVSNEDLYYRLSDVHAVIGAVLAGAFIVLVVRRWWLSTLAMRRTIGPVSLAAVVVASLFIVSVALLLFSLGRPWVWSLRNQVFALEAFFTALIPFAVLVGLVRGRLDRAEVAGMLVRLEEGGPGDLRTVLAEAVGDPGLGLARDAADGGLEDLAGRPVTAPRPGDRRTATPFEGPSGVRIWLIHDVALQENPELLRSTGVAARLTLENERLEAALRQQLAEVRASRSRIVEASDAERRRIERDLHDGAQQRLVTVALLLQLLREQRMANDARATELLDSTIAELEAAIVELRELARGIHPAILTQSGLRSAIESIALRAPIDVSMDVPDTRFAPAVEAAAYFVVAEGLTNIVRYSGASVARIELTHAGQALRLTISDDGRGGADPATGTGLRGLVDRLSTVGGSLRIESPPGHGTRLHALIPCE